MNADDLAKILDELGQRLGPTGEHVFALAVQYQLTSAILVLVGCVIGLAISLGVIAILARITRQRWVEQVRLYAEGNGDRSYKSAPDLEDFLMPWMFGSIVGAIPVIGLIAAAGSALVTIANPEYSALRDIIGTIKP